MPFLGIEKFEKHFINLIKLLSPFSLENTAMTHYNHHKTIKLRVAILRSTRKS